MRIYGAILVVLSCGMMGMIVARSYVERVRYVKNLLTLVQSLETEIQFARTTLPEAMLSISKQIKGPVANFLQNVVHHLDNEQGITISAAWNRGLAILENNGIHHDVLDDLATFGSSLGISDVDDQKKHLNLLRIRLEQAYERAEAEKQTNLKLWNYLGFGTGFLITLLLY